MYGDAIVLLDGDDVTSSLVVEGKLYSLVTRVQNLTSLSK